MGDVAAPVQPASPFGAVLAPVARPDLDLAPVLLTWELAVFIVTRPDRRRSAFATVPGPVLDGFVRALEHGDLDASLGAYLGTRPTSRRLLSDGQAKVPGLYDRLGIRAALLRPERDYWGNVLRLVPRSRRSLVPTGIRAA